MHYYCIQHSDWCIVSLHMWNAVEVISCYHLFAFTPRHSCAQWGQAIASVCCDLMGPYMFDFKFYVHLFGNYILPFVTCRFHPCITSVITSISKLYFFGSGYNNCYSCQYRGGIQGRIQDFVKGGATVRHNWRAERMCSMRMRHHETRAITDFVAALRICDHVVIMAYGSAVSHSLSFFLIESSAVSITL